MNTIQVNTNVHCSNCVDKISPHLDQDPNIIKWNFDLKKEIKTLIVTGNNISDDYVNSILSTEGYQILPSNTPLNATGNFSWKNIHNWKRASFNTLNCLIGCSIGDFGMIIFLQAFYPDTSMMWQMILAIIAGLFTSISLETIILKYREQFNWTLAIKTAFGMSFISMVGMEIAMNTTDFVVTGGKAAFEDPMYWTALLIAMIAGFLAPLPYNYYKLEKYNKACH
ncbi:DUF4396 domain-containing protein [Reichenbachiella versicolor]|uniref:DUF4396 domain-containing protein n=1 Tax=Reichenbachiella versicolor TaxID=1821036 RepID=UPI000D6E1A32|nr:DUF4396 domain-containing protein [Reichenbachiella versicolor]